jgi:hypothetical protein
MWNIVSGTVGEAGVDRGTSAKPACHDGNGKDDEMTDNEWHLLMSQPDARELWGRTWQRMPTLKTAKLSYLSI